MFKQLLTLIDSLQIQEIKTKMHYNIPEEKMQTLFIIDCWENGVPMQYTLDTEGNVLAAFNPEHDPDFDEDYEEYECEELMDEDHKLDPITQTLVNSECEELNYLCKVLGK